MKTIIILAGAALLVLGGFVGGIAYRPKSTEAAAKIGVSQKPQRRVLHYVDPMHPAYTSDKPGIAPDCGMKLVPVYEGDAPAMPSMPGMIKVAADKQQLIGVQYGEATITSIGGSFRAVGKVAQDETRVVHVHTKIEGWIEKVHADFTGALVEKGQPLVTIYSPELLAAQQEYLLALRARDILKSSPLIEAAENSDSLIRAARVRLELLDLGRVQINDLEKGGQAQRAITLFAPASGFVIARNAFSNLKVTPDTELYTIVDLSRIWIVADVFESDAPNVRIGQTAAIELPDQSGKGFLARVSYVYPQVDPVTRTLKVRLDAPNPAMRFKPDMFVNIEFRMAAQRKLTVPAEAVLDAGLRKTIFVDHGDGNLETRQVETGERLDGRIEIVKGLKAGERIVTSGNFLIDSESQLKQPAAQADPHAGHAGAHQHD